MTATKKPPKKDDKQTTIDRFKSVFETIDGFFVDMEKLDQEITTQRVQVEETRGVYDNAKQKLKDLEALREGAEKSLVRFLRPQPGEILPLFDQMKDADETIHGQGASEWRKEPISALRISGKALELLTAADIYFVGQLQDRVMDDADKWWEKVTGLSEGIAAAIVDGLNEFIFKRSE